MVFDKAYNLYSQFDKWTNQKIWFVTRMKYNSVYHVTKVLVDHTKKKNPKGVIKEQLITVGYKDGAGTMVRVKLRRITFIVEDGKQYVFLTNNLTLAASKIAVIYKCRWMIELLFKQIKQNFPLRYFWGNSEKLSKCRYTVY